MRPLFEAVPNFSEGRRKQVVARLAAAVRSAGGVRILDVQTDADHNRAVVTIVSDDPIRLGEAVLAGARQAVRSIDLRDHRGEHPRMGAVDVVPFVALSRASEKQCVALARATARRIGEELGIPVFCYGLAAFSRNRRDLSRIRNASRQFEQFRGLVGRYARWNPDFGPKRVHRTAGCTAVGARGPLVAYNVDLESADVGVAKKIASVLRQRGNGIRALGMMMSRRGRAQVSMNLTGATVPRALSAVRDEARALGVKVHSSEIVGLVPRAALGGRSARELLLWGFDPDRQILENALAGA